MIVIDASVAIKWFVLEERREAAEAVLVQIKSQPDQFAVPDLFYVEMMSVLVRLLKRQEEVHQVVTDLFDLGLTQVRVGAALLKEAAGLALECKLSGYDAIYLACARGLKGIWLTADRKAYQKVAGLSCVKCL